MIDQRSEPRFALDDEVSLTAPDLDTRLAQVMDASAHGLRLRIDHDLGPGTPVKVRLDFLDPSHPGANPVFVGDVRHHFAEPGGGSWQIGLRLRFSDEGEEKAFFAILQTVLSHGGQ